MVLPEGLEVLLEGDCAIERQDLRHVPSGNLS